MLIKWFRGGDKPLYVNTLAEEIPETAEQPETEDTEEIEEKEETQE